MIWWAATLFVVLVLAGLFMAVIGNPFIDWLSRRTSEITVEEAERRAKATRFGQWPPPPPSE